MARQSFQLNPDVIKSLEDIESIMAFKEQFSIPEDGLQDLDDYKYRFMLHYQKMEHGNIRKKIVQTMQEAAIKDKDKRGQLKTLIMQMYDVLKGAGLFKSDLPEDNPIKTLSRLLKEEGTSEDLAEDIERRKELLEEKNGICKILVAGETKAGKSSCLNLLFQDPVLIEKIVSCTSVITTVQNKGRRSAKVIRNNGETTDIDPLDEERLSEVLCHTGDHREFHDIREVEVSINSDLLDNTLILADTPGIGENEFLEKYLIDYINNNEIHGFIYIIKTDNAGGVQQDLLLNLLSIILKQHKAQGEKGRRFDPRAALFVCNRFDAIDPLMREEVKAHVLKQLGSIWPDLLESQVIFFSKKIAQRDLDADPDYINSDLQAFLEGLRDLYLMVLDKRIKANYKWVDNLLRRSFHHVRTAVRMLDLSEHNLQLKIESIVERLSILDKKSDDIIRNLEIDVEELSATICTDLEPYMKNPQLRTRLLLTWTEDEIPSGNEKNASWGSVKARVEKAFYNKLADVLIEWDEEHKVIKRHETEMTQKVREGLNLLEDEMELIEADIRGSSSLRDSLGEARIVALGDAGVDFKSYGLRLDIIKDRPRRLPFAKNYLERYKKNPVRYAQHRSKKLLQRLLQANGKHQSGLLPFVRWLLDHLYKYLEHLKTTIPQIISTNHKQCDGYQKHQIKDRQYLQDYEKLANSFEKIRRTLQLYGRGHIFVDDFKQDEVRVQNVTENNESFLSTFRVSDMFSGTTTAREKQKSKNPQGLWTVVRTGVLSRYKKDKDITIRVYLKSSGVDNTFHEVAKLRIISNPYLAEFLGIHYTDAPTPAFIYDGSYWSLRRYITENIPPGNDGTHDARTKTSVSILQETASGLDYLHNKRMVHMELSQDTITITSSGQVKLTGACFPRVATLPGDKVRTKTGDFVYLAPEVLRGDKYTFPADVYSFGILSAEILSPPFIAFRKEKKTTLSEFISYNNPSEVFDWESLLHLPKNLTDLIQRCMNRTVVLRPSTEDISLFFKQGKRQISTSLSLDTAFPNDISSSGTYGVPSFLTQSNQRRQFSQDSQR
ncbi:hypothetical protein CHS0354_009099 [Potamilus streckersoni]|uniref:Protein kinase domain-containing protein n=1 Tax=Potamilus streckersoni TaxID=2493646 RepID=A0AAE0WDX0_9BIVA|nr:hypothetical protein CHS0354_009099 [Potamilus streckersoni]